MNCCLFKESVGKISLIAIIYNISEIENFFIELLKFLLCNFFNIKKNLLNIIRRVRLFLHRKIEIN